MVANATLRVFYTQDRLGSSRHFPTQDKECYVIDHEGHVHIGNSDVVVWRYPVTGILDVQVLDRNKGTVSEYSTSLGSCVLALLVYT